MQNQRIALLEKYMEEEPTNPFNIYALAMEYYESLPEQSLPLLNQLLEKHADYLPTYFKAAHIYWDFEDWEKANDLFIKGIELAKMQKDEKAVKELSSAYQNFEIDWDPA